MPPIYPELPSSLLVSHSSTEANNQNPPDTGGDSSFLTWERTKQNKEKEVRRNNPQKERIKKSPQKAVINLLKETRRYSMHEIRTGCNGREKSTWEFKVFIAGMKIQ